ncbi:SGNH/GDSL hydrolase family protein [uncultured Tateyamaria sp.]|uniref:SGNH/GDSL hydrolase family protein n=1 Tax=uncultured Tateyamaria sp. TaxID=455651 RepID=UPI00262B8C91|nr:SGNH/GDSL hydrolase family protein [uncultured Tateyamaria sp.]
MKPVTNLLRLPIILPQALWVAARAVRLPEPPGPREGQDGEGAPLRVLILGDSSAAGVGVDHQDQALSGRLVARLGHTHTVYWQLWAQSGLTTSAALRLLSEHSHQRFDLAVVALGVNDVKNGVHVTRWQSNYARLIGMLKRRFGVRRIYASGVPPMGAFPLLPQPLRGTLGDRATRFDATLVALCQREPGVVHMPFDVDLDPGMMAADGFHPGAKVYDIWAERIVAALSEDPLD